MIQTNKASYRKRKKKQVSDPKGKAYIKATFNNIIISFTDSQGNVLTWSSAGHKGFRGARKSTPYAAQSCTEAASLEVYEMGLRTVDIYIKGPGGRKRVGHSGYCILWFNYFIYSVIEPQFLIMVVVREKKDEFKSKE